MKSKTQHNIQRRIENRMGSPVFGQSKQSSSDHNLSESSNISDSDRKKFAILTLKIQLYKLNSIITNRKNINLQ